MLLYSTMQNMLWYNKGSVKIKIPLCSGIYYTFMISASLWASKSSIFFM